MSEYGEAMEGLGTTESGQLRRAFEQLGNGCFAVNKSLDVEVGPSCHHPCMLKRSAACTASEKKRVCVCVCAGYAACRRRKSWWKSLRAH
jgi:hypothetical protein